MPRGSRPRPTTKGPATTPDDQGAGDDAGEACGSVVPDVAADLLVPQ
jgi:hypothetical protein